MKIRFFICNHCGNIIAMVKDSGISIQCCGEEMEEIINEQKKRKEEYRSLIDELKKMKKIVIFYKCKHIIKLSDK